MHMNYCWRRYIFFILYIFFPNRVIMKTDKRENKKNPEECKQSHYIHSILPGRRTPWTPESRWLVEEPPANETISPCCCLQKCLWSWTYYQYCQHSDSHHNGAILGITIVNSGNLQKESELNDIRPMTSLRTLCNSDLTIPQVIQQAE